MNMKRNSKLNMVHFDNLVAKGLPRKMMIIVIKDIKIIIAI